MNFSISQGIGFLGGWVIFGALMIAFTVIVSLVVRAVRGRDDTPAEPGAGGDRRAPEDDYIL